MEGIRARRRGRAPPQRREVAASKLQLEQNRFPVFTIIRYLVFAVIFIMCAVILSQFDTVRQFRFSKRKIRSSTNGANATETASYDFYVTIYAFDRPRQLLHLLNDIAREADAAKLKVGVNVIDDNSYGCVFSPVHENIFDVHGTGSLDMHLITVNPAEDFPNCAARSRFRRVEVFLQLRGWNMYVSKYRHGRRRHWHLVRMAHMLLHPISTKFFLFLPDDDRLARSFFTEVTGLWSYINDSRKLTLMLHVEESRERVPVWTDFKPRKLGGGISRVGWVESGNFLCTEDFLRFVNWSFPRVPVQRWINNPPISSGVGSTLSESIHASGKRMYRSDRSFVAHVGVSSSKMNSEFRKKNIPSLATKYFADGDSAYEDLLREACTVTASIASQWTRETALHSAVESLSSQVDHLNVYLNGYDAVPAYLYAPYITVITSSDSEAKGDIGDIGKFFWCNNITSAYHLTADDDIVYPPDYVAALLSFSRQYVAPVVVGAHGIRIKEENLNPPTGMKSMGYYGSREVWMGTDTVTSPVSVHILGTGTMLYRPVDIGNIELDSVFPSPNMADIWFGILAQQRKLPMLVIPHKEGWLKEVPGTFEDSIYKRATRSRSADRRQTEAVKRIDKWHLYKSRNSTNLT